MSDRVCVMTGATSGIGLAAAQGLARQGVGLVLVGRDERRGAAALAAVRAAAPGAEVSIRYADLLSLAEIRRLAAGLLADCPRIDILVNNAGAFFDAHALTVDGLERTFALNHMSYFLLTYLLLDRLREAPQGRIVSVASAAHRGAALDFDDLPGRRGAKGWAAYGRSKLANILFTAELARRLAGSRATADCLHPGFVASRFGEPGNGPLMRTLIGVAKRLAAITPEAGARTILHLATAPEVAGVSGAYFVKNRAVQPSPAARDPQAARRLWQESLRLAGLSDEAAA